MVFRAFWPKCQYDSDQYSSKIALVTAVYHPHSVIFAYIQTGITFQPNFRLKWVTTRWNAFFLNFSKKLSDYENFADIFADVSTFYARF